MLLKSRILGFWIQVTHFFTHQQHIKHHVQTSVVFFIFVHWFVRKTNFYSLVIIFILLVSPVTVANMIKDQRSKEFGFVIMRVLLIVICDGHGNFDRSGAPVVVLQKLAHGRGHLARHIVRQLFGDNVVFGFEFGHFVNLFHIPRFDRVGGFLVRPHVRVRQGHDDHVRVVVFGDAKLQTSGGVLVVFVFHGNYNGVCGNRSHQ
mmetsp:Transcript_4271/g.11653  ORF Transcript_4271/g.11653 Transcript_4271/m.11653 type:complete len:204 (-) Transcript_4271:263-874(-)